MIYSSPEEILIDDRFLKVDLINNVSVFAKLEQFNLGGSIKIKAALGLIEHYEQQGVLNKHKKIVESSSGNMGVALAMVCNNKGYDFTCVTDPNVSPTNVRLMKAYGAKVVVIERGVDGGFVSARLAKIKQMKEEDPDLIWVDQYSCEANWKAHYKSTAPSIFKEFPNVDYIFTGVGSGGTIMGISRYIAEHSLKAKLIAVDPYGSVLFGKTPCNRYIPGIGGSVVPSIFDKTKVDGHVIVKEKDTLKTCHEFAKERGWLIGGSTGTAIAGIRQYAEQIKPDSTVVFVAPDFGVNYLDTIYENKWCNNHFGEK